LAFSAFAALLSSGIEDAEFIEPEFPRSDGIGSKRLLPFCFDFCIDLQMRNDPGDDNTLIMRFEVRNVAFSAFR